MKKPLILAMLLFMAVVTLHAQQATVRLNAQVQHQHVTGFGAFVCSPQFQYNHMSTTEIKSVWGATSTVGCNIMRLYIPIGRSAWSQSLQTAKTAKQLGLIVFASPWGQPAEWKTNNSINAKTDSGQEGRLKAANWADYAQYLEDYVQYLRQNGVELDAISIQNEPDWPAKYAGCLWSADEIAQFVKTYGKSISCKVMAPETLGVSDSYANALNNSDVLDCFDIYGGHQYGGLQSAYKNLGKKGKELWMTEYLINWNESENNTRNFDFSKDFFNFFRAINTCMLGDFNAWIHYAAKRYYGPLGDGQREAGSSGDVTKRGYIMAHFAKYVTGMTRIDATFAGGLEGSAYLSTTGDTVVAVVANSTDQAIETTFDLPFYTEKGQHRYTTRSLSFGLNQLTIDETCRPVATIAAQSVATLLFVKSRDRQPSDMKATATRFDRLDDMKTTNSTFGTTYKLSGKTGKKFDSSNPLISTRKNTTAGYIALDDRYTKLVMQVRKVTTTSSLTAGATTLTYVDGRGQVATHEYGRIDLSQGENFDITLDLSPATLPNGCKGLLSLTCDNTMSHLTFAFGDVYLVKGSSTYHATLSGSYVADDSNVLDYSADPACTSIDLTAVDQLPATLPWIEGTNRIAYVAEGSATGQPNVVAAGNCPSLMLLAGGGDFRPETEFTANSITLTMPINGMRLVMLPFQAAVPEGASAYALGADMALTPLTSIAAHQPVVVQAPGTVVFRGSGATGYAVSPLTDMLRGTYTAAQLCQGDYVLAQADGQWGLKRVTTTDATLHPFEAYAQLSATDDFIPLLTALAGDVNGDGAVNVGDIMAIINYMAAGDTNAKGDVNGDGAVNVGDIMAVINIMAQQQ